MARSLRLGAALVACIVLCQIAGSAHAVSGVQERSPGVDAARRRIEQAIARELSMGHESQEAQASNDIGAEFRFAERPSSSVHSLRSVVARGSRDIHPIAHMHRHKQVHAKTTTTNQTPKVKQHTTTTVHVESSGHAEVKTNSPLPSSASRQSQIQTITVPTPAGAVEAQSPQTAQNVEVQVQGGSSDPSLSDVAPLSAKELAEEIRRRRAGDYGRKKAKVTIVNNANILQHDVTLPPKPQPDTTVAEALNKQIQEQKLKEDQYEERLRVREAKVQADAEYDARIQAENDKYHIELVAEENSKNVMKEAADASLLKDKLEEQEAQVRAQAAQAQNAQTVAEQAQKDAAVLVQGPVLVAEGAVLAPSSKMVNNYNSYSFAFWIKPDGAPGRAYTNILHKGTNRNDKQPAISFLPNSLALSIRSGTSNAPNAGFEAPNAPLVQGVWTHVTVTHGKTRGIVLYLNGNQVASANILLPPAMNNAPLYGSNPWEPKANNCLLSDVRYYASELTAPEILDIVKMDKKPAE